MSILTHQKERIRALSLAGLSPGEIARELNCSRSSVYWHLSTMGLTPQESKNTIRRKKILAMAKRGLSSHAIGEVLGCDSNIVSRVIGASKKRGELREAQYKHTPHAMRRTHIFEHIRAGMLLKEIGKHYGVNGQAISLDLKRLAPLPSDIVDAIKSNIEHSRLLRQQEARRIKQSGGRKRKK